MDEAAVISKVQGLLASVESEEAVRVLFAAESGSRAWGFPSRDSDYDVRFIYVHPRAWYLSIDSESRRDVIERPVADEIDLSGWDIRKALRLFAKANPPLIEWLSSPLIYTDWNGFRRELSDLLQVYYQPRSCMYHYLHMAQNNRREYLNGPIVWVKKYLYVLRPVLAVKWIEQGRGPVPISFHELLVTIHDQRDLLKEVETLVERKGHGDELDRAPSIPVISVFIEQEMERMSKLFMHKEPSPIDLEPLDQLFRARLSDAPLTTT